MLQLPEVYQQAIFNNDLNQFKQKDIFYFGYAEGSRMLSWFLRMIAKRHSQKTSEGAPKKDLTFYFMGNKWSNKFHPREIEQIKTFNVKEIILTQVKDENLQRTTVPITEKEDDISIKVVSGFIQNKFVPYLVKAAKETISTGDESMAEIYAAGKVPLVYETLTQKMKFRKNQLESICSDLLKANPSLQQRCDLIKKDGGTLAFGLAMLGEKPQNPPASEMLLDLKEEAGVRQGLNNHLKRVHETLNFEKNFLALLNSKVKEIARISKVAPQFIENPDHWPINKKFLVLDKELNIYGISDGMIKPNKNNEKLYQRLKDKTFQVSSENFYGIRSMEIKNQ